MTPDNYSHKPTEFVHVPIPCSQAGIPNASIPDASPSLDDRRMIAQALERWLAPKTTPEPTIAQALITRISAAAVDSLAVGIGTRLAGLHEKLKTETVQATLHSLKYRPMSDLDLGMGLQELENAGIITYREMSRKRLRVTILYPHVMHPDVIPDSSEHPYHWPNWFVCFKGACIPWPVWYRIEHEDPVLFAKLSAIHPGKHQVDALGSARSPA